MPPLITIGITCFNSSETILRALYSAFNQTWPNKEVIVVDDCSTDSTYDILHSLLQDHPDLTVITNPYNAGVAYSRNRIIDLANGQYLAFFDDDDYSEPNRLVNQYEALSHHLRDYGTLQHAVVYSSRRIVYSDSRTLAEHASTQPNLTELETRKILSSILIALPKKMNPGSCPTCAQFASLSSFKAIGGFNNALRRFEDVDFNLRHIASGGAIISSSLDVTQYMSLTSDKPLKTQFRYHRKLLYHNKKLLISLNLYAFARYWVSLKYFLLLRNYQRALVCFLVMLIRNPFLTISCLSNTLPNLKGNILLRRYYCSRTL